MKQANFRLVVIVTAFLAVATGLGQSQDLSLPTSATTILHQVADIHGEAGPFAVAGYRIGECALKELRLQRGSFSLEVIHKTPFKVQWSCVADGVQAATGVSVGKLNLWLEQAPIRNMQTIVRNRKTGQALVFRLQPQFVKKFLNLPEDELEAAGRQVLSLSDGQIFSVTLEK
jgi:formylmethanofuran dehydrogenase subunit E